MLQKITCYVSLYGGILAVLCWSFWMYEERHPGGYMALYVYLFLLFLGYLVPPATVVLLSLAAWHRLWGNDMLRAGLLFGLLGSAAVGHAVYAAAHFKK